MTNVGIIGTGMLGEAVGLHLLNSNYTVTVFNRTKDKTEKLVDAGATLAESSKEVAENSDLVITVVRDADAVSQVAFGENGIISGKHDGLVIADMSTINPNSAKEISMFFDKGVLRLAIILIIILLHYHLEHDFLSPYSEAQAVIKCYS